MVFTKETLWALRKSICLNSIYYYDYRNDVGVEEHICFNFFDGYVDYLLEMMREDGCNDFSRYDTPNNLYSWYLCFGEDCLPISEVYIIGRLTEKINEGLPEFFYRTNWAIKPHLERVKALNNYMIAVVGVIEEIYPEMKDKQLWYAETLADITLEVL